MISTVNHFCLLFLFLMETGDYTPLNTMVVRKVHAFVHVLK